MQVEAALDVPFLAGVLFDLAVLNGREFEESPELLARCLARLLARVLRWYKEKPDNWRDARSLAFGSHLCDCEDIAALLGAILSFIFADVWVGIRRVSPTLCHALVKVGNRVIDACPLLGMPKGNGEDFGTEWRRLPDNRDARVKDASGKPGDKKVIDVGMELVAQFLGKKPAEVKTEVDKFVDESADAAVNKKTDATRSDLVSSEGDESDTGASASSILAALFPPAAVDQIEKGKRDTAKLTADLKKAAAEYKRVSDMLKAEQGAHNKTKAALKSTQEALNSTRKECDGAKKSLSAALASEKQDKQRLVSLAEKVQDNLEESYRKKLSDTERDNQQKVVQLESALAAARALQEAQQKQIAELEKRSDASNRDYIATLKAQLAAPSYADEMAAAFVEDPTTIFDQWATVEAAGVVLTGGVKSACCDDCAAGRPCASGACSTGDHDHGGHDHHHEPAKGQETADTGSSDVDMVTDLDDLDTGAVRYYRAAPSGCKTGTCPLPR